MIPNSYISKMKFLPCIISGSGYFVVVYIYINMTQKLTILYQKQNGNAYCMHTRIKHKIQTI